MAFFGEGATNEGAFHEALNMAALWQLPVLYPASFSFSPAIADGDLISYRMCDWIDNAVTLQMAHAEGPVYGYLHLPCKVELNSRLMQAPAGEAQRA